MKVKVTRFEEAKQYTAPGHSETVHTMHMQHQSMGCEAPYWVGCSHYLPGAEAEMSASPLDKIYVVIEGELTVELGNKEIIKLGKGDSIWIGQDEMRSVTNKSNAVATMLVVMPYPA
jgi:mannose-6-phosphate isomerase-like protein (cupin superfamily)